LYTSEVLHLGWELDNVAWVVRLVDRSTIVVSTNHVVFSVDEDWEAKLAPYRRVLAETERALTLVCH